MARRSDMLRRRRRAGSSRRSNPGAVVRDAEGERSGGGDAVTARVAAGTGDVLQRLDAAEVDGGLGFLGNRPSAAWLSTVTGLPVDLACG